MEEDKCAKAIIHFMLLRGLNSCSHQGISTPNCHQGILGNGNPGDGTVSGGYVPKG